MGSFKSWAEDRSSVAAQGILSTGSSFLRSRDGAAAAEFALTVMLLVMFLFGIITFGWMFFLDNNMETAAREGARRMAVAEAPYAGSDVTCADAQAQTPGTAENIACSMLPNWGGTITVNAANLCDEVPPDRAVRVRVSANGEDVALADIFGFFNGKTMTATVEMRKEAECS